MRKFSYLSLVCLTALAFIFVSCDDKDPDPPPQKSKTELITTGSWRFGSAMWGTTDAGAMLQACQKDNTITFQGGGAGVVDEGLTKCNVSDPQTIPFTWNFQSGESEIFLSNPLFTPGGSNTMTLVTLTTAELSVSQPFTFGSVTKTLVITFIH